MIRANRRIALTMLSYAGRDCACGNRVMVRGAELRYGRLVSCGCALRDSVVRRKARMKVPVHRRRQIARLGAAAAVKARRVRGPCGARSVPSRNLRRATGSADRGDSRVHAGMRLVVPSNGRIDGPSGAPGAMACAAAPDARGPGTTP